MLNMTYNTGNTQPALKPSASATALAAKVQLAAAQRAALGEIHNVRKKVCICPLFFTGVLRPQCYFFFDRRH